MTLALYTWIHLGGIALTLLALGALSQPSDLKRKSLSIAHGVGLFLALLGGFGMLARAKISATEPTIMIKIALWLALGASIALFKRKSELSTPLWWGVWIIFLIAGYLGIHLTH